MAGIRSASAAAACLVVMMTLAAHGATVTHFAVGGPVGWSDFGLEFGRDPDFFQTWAHRNFPYHTTDELEFRWAYGDSVLLVSYEDFKECFTRRPILAWYSTGEQTSVVFPLHGNAFHTLYFITGNVAHCRSGQKLYIDVFE